MTIYRKNRFIRKKTMCICFSQLLCFTFLRKIEKQRNKEIEIKKNKTWTKKRRKR